MTTGPNNDVNTHGTTPNGALEAFFRMAERRSLYGELELTTEGSATSYIIIGGRLALPVVPQGPSESLRQLQMSLLTDAARHDGSYRCGPLMDRPRADATVTVGVSEIFGPERKAPVTAPTETPRANPIPTPAPTPEPFTTKPALARPPSFAPPPAATPPTAATPPVAAPTPVQPEPAPFTKKPEPQPQRQAFAAPQPQPEPEQPVFERRRSPEIPAALGNAGFAPAVSKPHGLPIVPLESGSETSTAIPQRRSTDPGFNKPEAPTGSADSSNLRSAQIRRILESLEDDNSAPAEAIPELADAPDEAPNRRSALRSIIRNLATK